MISYKAHVIEGWTLTGEGTEYAKAGSPEFQFWDAVGEEGASKASLQVSLCWPGVVKRNSSIRISKAKLGSHYPNAERNALKSKLVRLDPPNFRRVVCDESLMIFDI
jgi:hypothetical protein